MNGDGGVSRTAFKNSVRKLFSRKKDLLQVKNFFHPEDNPLLAIFPENN